MKFTIKPEYLHLWGEDATTDTIITTSELVALAKGWEMEISDLIQQCNCIEDASLFSEVWGAVRDFYAPTMSAPEAARRAVKILRDNGHDAVLLTKTSLIIDNEFFEIKKHRGWSHFDLRKYCH